MSSLVKELNLQQQDAVLHDEGHALVLAGAGSGKTRVLTYRVAHLLDLGIRPYRILLLTFTNKAASEMQERVVELVGNKGEDILSGTFHSVCAKLLRIDCDKLGYDKNFTICDRSDQEKMLRDIIKNLGYSDRVEPGDMASYISYLKSRMVGPQEFEDQVNSADYPLVRIYYTYQEQMLYENKMDFGDLICNMVRLLERDKEIREKYQRRFQHILIDEYQDTSPSQYRLLTLLTGPGTNLFAVGDADQAIYGFRGADMSNILSFTEDYPESQIYRLERNYRSTATILQAANSLIVKNTDRYPKELWTNADIGTPIALWECDDGEHEAWMVAEEIENLVAGGEYKYKDICVLYRVNTLCGGVEKQLIERAIPYEVVGGLDFFDRAEIRDILAYLKVLANPRDTVSLKRIINTPARGIGNKTIEALERYGLREGVGLMGAIFAYNLNTELKSKAKAAVKEFIELLRKLDSCATVDETIATLLDETGYLNGLEEERVEHVSQLREIAQTYDESTEAPTVAEFLQEISLVSDVDNMDDDNKVKLMTVHTAKGLEFPIVFIVGLEQGLFPHVLSIKEKSIDEERRLCYVALTRAQERLYLSYTRRRIVFGNHLFRSPSQFLGEIDPDVFYQDDYAESAVARGESRWRMSS